MPWTLESGDSEALPGSMELWEHVFLIATTWEANRQLIAVMASARRGGAGGTRVLRAYVCYACTCVTGTGVLGVEACYWIRATNSTFPVLSGPT